MAGRIRSPVPESYWHSHLACLHGCLRHVGVRSTPGWLFGVTGQAFAVADASRASDIAPSAGAITALVAKVGGRVEVILSSLMSAPSTDDRAATLTAIQAAMSAGHACYGRDVAFGGCHCIVACDAGGYHYVETSEGAARRGWTDLSGPTWVAVVSRCSPADDVDAIRSGLQAALAGTELLADAVEGWLDTGAPRRIGDVQERREYAVEFMWEAKERLLGQHAGLFNVAAEEVDRVARALRTLRAGSIRPARERSLPTISALTRRER
ncbi:MAG: hypothetical protein ABGY41_15650 [Candidatus Poribacteria bacterium]